MPSSKSCSKSVTGFSALNLISTPLQLFIFKQPKGIPVPVKTGFTVPTVFSLWEDLEDLPRSPGLILKSRAAITTKMSKFIVFVLHWTTPRGLKMKKLRALIHLTTCHISCGWTIHRKAPDHHTSPYFWESFNLQPFQQERPTVISKILRCQ